LLCVGGLSRMLRMGSNSTETGRKSAAHLGEYA